MELNKYRLLYDISKTKFRFSDHDEEIAIELIKILENNNNGITWLNWDLINNLKVEINLKYETKRAQKTEPPYEWLHSYDYVPFKYLENNEEYKIAYLITTHSIASRYGAFEEYEHDINSATHEISEFLFKKIDTITADRNNYSLKLNVCDDNDREIFTEMIRDIKKELKKEMLAEVEGLSKEIVSKANKLLVDKTALLNSAIDAIKNELPKEEVKKLIDKILPEIPIPVISTVWKLGKCVKILFRHRSIKMIETKAK